MDPLSNHIQSLSVLVLNVHSLCNCRCVMCDIWKRQAREELRRNDLEVNRDAWLRLGVRWVVMSGGEPLLHTDLRAICSLFREDKIRLTLLTTGLLLGKRADEVAELFDDVIISLDGPPDVHDAIRRVSGAFKLIAEGVAAVRVRRPAMRFSGRTTVQKANHRRLLDTVASAKQIGLDSLSFLAADLTSEAFNRPLQWPPAKQSEIALTLDETVQLGREIERLIHSHAEDIESGFIAESAPKLRKIVNHFRAHLGEAANYAPMCNAPWTSAVIEADGSVRPCFFHPVIGNIRNAALEDVLNSKTALEFRRSLDISTNPICRRCVCSLYCPSHQPENSEAIQDSVRTAATGASIEPPSRLP